MPSVFNQALGQLMQRSTPEANISAPAESTNAYQMLLQELQNPIKTGTGPVFSPDEVRQRIAQNNQLIQLGAIGGMAGDERVNKFGGSIFKQALSGRDERQTDRGIQDPLTGETRIDPEYAAGQERTRRGQVLQQALGYQKSQEERADRLARQREHDTAEAQRRREHDATLRTIAASKTGAAGGLGKPPPGFRWTAEGDLQAIPGGPAAAKFDAAAGKAKLAADKAALADTTLLNNIDNVVSKAQLAKEQAGPFTTGLSGRVLGQVAGGEAYDLRRTLDTVKANLGFNELTAMRQASPTGGALGQVAVKELEFLQAARANLDANQSESQLKQSLDDIITHYNNWKSVVQEHRAGSGQGGSTPSPTPPAPVAPGGGVTPAQPLGGQSRLSPEQAAELAALRARFPRPNQ